MTDEQIIREALDRLEGTIAEDVDAGSAEAWAFARREVKPAREALARIESKAQL